MGLDYWALVADTTAQRASFSGDMAMIRRVILMTSLIGLAGCLALEPDCEDEYDWGGIGGSGSCDSPQKDWVNVGS